MISAVFVLANLTMLLLGGCVVAWAGQRQQVLRPAMTSFALHVAMASLIFAVAGLWAPDAMLYDRIGQALHEKWTSNSPYVPRVTAGKEGFPTVLAALYTLFGHHPTVGVLFNVTASSLLVPVAASTARILDLPVRRSAWLAGCLPPLLLWGSVLLREATSWLLLALVIRGLVAVAQGHGRPWVNWLLVLLPLGALVTIRGTAAILVGVAVLVTFVISAKHRTLPVLVLLVGLAIAAPSLASLGNEIAGGYDVEAINRQRSALSRDASSSFEVQQYSGLGGMLLAAPINTVRGLFGPFPWELPAVGAFLSLDVLFWWAIVACTILGWRAASDRRRLLPMLVPALTMIVVLSITSGNYGTMIRLRYQAAVMVLPLAALGMEHLLARRQARRATLSSRERAGRQRRIASRPARPRPLTTH